MAYLLIIRNALGERPTTEVVTASNQTVRDHKATKIFSGRGFNTETDLILKFDGVGVGSVEFSTYSRSNLQEEDD